MADKSYTGISNPYDDNLERTGDPSQGATAGGPTSTGDYGGIEDSNSAGSGTEDVTSAAGESSSSVIPGATVGASLNDLWVSTWIKSRSYQPKVSGFYIDGKSGYAEFANVYVVGTVVASAGSIGRWTINATTITGGDATLDSTGVITLGTGNNIVKLSAVDATYRIWVGNATAASAPFSVTKAGAIAATSGTIGGFTLGSDYIRDTADSFGFASTVTGGNDVRIWAGASFANRATAPFIVYEDGSVIASGLTVDHIDIPNTTTANSFHVDTAGLLWSGANVANKATAPVRLNPTGEMTLGSPAGLHLQLSGPNIRIQSSNYVTGSVGFLLSPTLVEAENIIARGTMSGSAFKYDVISAVGGQVMVANSDIISTDMTALDSSTMTIRGDSTFAANDILVIRNVATSGIQEEWFRVTNAASAPTYTVTRDLAGVYAANSNPVWKAGTPVVKQGKSDGAAAYSGGWLRLFGEGTNSPYYSVYARTGLLYNSYSEVTRLGNLNGIGGFVADTYGIFIGDTSTGKFMNYDTVSGNLVVNNSPILNQDLFGDGSDGSVTISADTSLSSDVFYDNLTINTGKILNTNGFRVFVKGTLTTNGTGKISRDGNAGGNGADATTFVGGQGAGGTAGAALADGSIKGALAGVAGASGVTGVVAFTNFVNGTTGGSGANGVSVAKSLATSDGIGGNSGGTGGNAENGGPSTATGGTAGAATSGGGRTGTVYNLIHNSIAAYRLYDDNGAAFLTAAPSNGAAASGSSGGAISTVNNSAGSGSTGGAGGGGSQGGIVVIFARTIINNGTISANGGAGGNAGTTYQSAASLDFEAAGGSGGSTGGDGGNGGIIILCYSSLTNNGTIGAAGGSGGNKSVGRAGASHGAGSTATAGTDGQNGSTGNTGVVIQLQI